MSGGHDDDFKIEYVPRGVRFQPTPTAIPPYDARHYYDQPNPSTSSRDMRMRKRPTAAKKNVLIDDIISGRVDAFVKPNIALLKSANADSVRSSVINGIDDIDFVLIVNKKSKPLMYRIGAAFARCLKKKDASVYEHRCEILRRNYLETLKSEYGVEWKVYESEEYTFYAITLSFAHHGLMTQLLGYHWRMAPCPSALPDINDKSHNATMQQNEHKEDDANLVAYKAFYFLKKIRSELAAHNDPSQPVNYRYKEYHQCQDRTSFLSQLRHDLAYNFLIGARVKLEMSETINPWHDAFDVENDSSINGRRPSSSTESKSHKEVNLHAVIEHHIFDDWLGALHQPMMMEDEGDLSQILTDPPPPASRNKCAMCCFTTMACDCCSCCRGNPAQQQQQVNNEQQPAPTFCSSFRNLWRNFWYSNSINCVDLVQRPTENDREFLARVSTFRNAVAPGNFFKDVVDENLRDDDDDWKVAEQEVIGDDGRNNNAKNSQHRRKEAITWRHILPLEKIRQYFGERIAFYFCWVELVIMSLIAPAVIGCLMFIGALIYYSVKVYNLRHHSDEGEKNSTTAAHVDFEDAGPGYVLAKACDNYSTIAFAAIMIIWGTTFVEMWKRRHSWYQYLWRVEHLEDSELRRVNVYAFQSTYKMHEHKFTHYLMYLPSLIVTLIFISVVWGSIYLINMLDVRLSNDYCDFEPPKTGDDEDDEYQNLAGYYVSHPITYAATTTVLYGNASAQAYTAADSSASSSGFIGKAKLLIAKATAWFLCNIIGVVMHSVSIVILDALYTKVVYPLTHIEGHQTQSSFNNSLILKMFAFRFVNNYSILFYIAFVVAPSYGSMVYTEELSGVNRSDTVQLEMARYRSCKELPCMTMLSKQLLGVILTSPLIHSFKDRVLSTVLRSVKLLFKKKKQQQQQAQAKNNQVGDISSSHHQAETTAGSDNIKLVNELLEQRELPELSTLSFHEFTIEEFIQRVIVFGALLMFSVALQPAPALAILIMRIDINFDIARMTESFRRPVPVRASGIGVWADIVEFLTFCGIVTNPLIVVLSSSWGRHLSIWWRFWVFIIFEHIVFALRQLIAFLIPDEPSELRQLRLRQKMAKQKINDRRG